MPGAPGGSTGSYATRELIEAQTVASHPDEVTFAQVSLADALLRARAARPAPHPVRATSVAAPGRPIAPPPSTEAAPPTPAPRSRWRRLLGLG